MVRAAHKGDCGSEAGEYA